MRRTYEQRALLREVRQLRSIVDANQETIKRLAEDIDECVQQAHALNQSVESRVEFYGRKKTKEMNKVKESAIRKLQQLISLCDLKVKDGVISQ